MKKPKNINYEETVDINGKSLAKAVAYLAVSTGAGAITAEALKRVDISNLKGLAKATAGFGAIGIAHWVAKNAGNTVSDEVESVFNFIHKLTGPAYPPVEEEDDEEYEEDEE